MLRGLVAPPAVATLLPASEFSYIRFVVRNEDLHRFGFAVLARLLALSDGSKVDLFDLLRGREAWPPTSSA